MKDKSDNIATNNTKMTIYICGGRNCMNVKFTREQKNYAESKRK